MEKTAMEYARCIRSDLEPISVIKSISTETLWSLLDRMGIEYEKGLPKEAYLIAWQEELQEHRDWIVRVFPEKYLKLLMEIWDSKKISMDAERWEMLQYLRMFGFVTYKKSNSLAKTENEIYIVESMKNNFYFYIKSKESKKWMKQYERWENAFDGYSYYCGILPLLVVHQLVCEALKEEIPYDEFVQFIKCRVDVWGLGSILTDQKGTEYFKNHNVENEEYTFLFIKEHEDLPYKKIGYEDLSYMKRGNGIDNRCPGISELGNYLMDHLDISYYRASVFLYTVIVSIQNGEEYEKIQEQLEILTFENPEEMEVAASYLKLLYENVPIYEYKGYTRLEYQKIQEQKEWKKRKKGFTIV